MLHNKIEMFSVPGFMINNVPQYGNPSVDLLSQMTLDEKTYQLASLYGYQHVLQDALPLSSWKNEIRRDGIGIIIEHQFAFGSGR